MRFTLFVLCAFLLVLSACTEAEFASQMFKSSIGKPSKSEGMFKVGNSYKVDGKWYHPQEDYNYSETGIASWYGPNFDGKPTANGEIYDMNELTAAHKTLQLPCLVRVTNLENGRSLVVRVNDRGPFKRGRIIDLSKRAAELLGFAGRGTAKVRVQVLAKESIAIAEAAKRGQDTSGVEVAMNESGTLPTHITQKPQPTAQQKVVQKPAPQPVQTAAIEQTVPGRYSNGNFYPDPVVEQVPVAPTTIYVQAGAFTIRENAQKLAVSLQSIGRAQVFPALVNGQQFYRVRIPTSNVEQADVILERIAQSGNKNAIIIVD